MTEPHAPLPDERPHRRREYSGAGSTLGVAALIILAVGVAIWWFEIRGDTGNGVSDEGFGVVAETGANPTGKSPAAETGRLAPNFRLASLDGEPRQLSDLRGRFVLVNFWASWCLPCRGEAPELQAFSDRNPDKIVVLGVNQQETAGDARSFADDFRLSYPLVLDRSGEVSNTYRARGLPVSYLVGPDGVILKTFLGRMTTEQLEELEQEFLAT